jgi:UDP-N-acetylmuramyl pentapeptide synthase
MQPIKANDLLNGIGALKENALVSAVCTDSREAKSGSLFVCIKGERTD